MAEGVRIRYKGSRDGRPVVLFPLPDRPYGGDSPPYCPICNVSHPVKTIHLWLDDSGACIVSTGVFEAMKSNASAFSNWQSEGYVKDPPDLYVGVPREQVDANNRRIRFFRRKW